MTTAAKLDERTAATVREAMAAAVSGRLDQACAIGEQALATGGTAAVIHAMLGTLYCRSGQLEQGIEHLRKALGHRPDDPVVARNLALALNDAWRPAEALEALSPALSQADATLSLERLRGQMAQAAELFDVAITSYERVVLAHPDDWAAWNNLGNARRGIGDFDGALAALRRAEQLSPDSPPIALNLAMTCGAAGFLVEAEDRLRRAAARFPQESQALRELFAFLKEQGREEEALEAISAAVSRSPADTDLLLALASQRLLLLDHDGAERSYRDVIDVEPANGLANLGLAIVFELTNRTRDLAALIDEATARGTSDDIVYFIRAFDARRKRDFAEGLRCLERVPDTLETARRAHLEGQLLEGAGRFDEAFAAYARMNELKREDPSQPEARAARYRDAVRSDMAALTAVLAESWCKEEPPYRGPTPVFLVGFPRSGTTLLDTILLSHPSVEILEEEPALKRATALLPEVAALSLLEDDLVREARALYYEVAARLTALKPGNMLVDKNPLHMNKLPAIRRLFPDAKIILAVRHPCDVILSCFATNFTLNAGMSNFIALSTAAELYDLSFSYFEQARSLLQMPTHLVFYEKIVADQEGELRRLFEFLELEWDQAVLDHVPTARDRARIKTASYAQVIEPVHAGAMGRWRNYRPHLEPIFPVIAPWVKKFGYSLDAVPGPNPPSRQPTSP